MTLSASELRIGNLLCSNNKKYRPDKFGKVCVVTAIDTNKSKIQNYSGVSCTMYVLNDEYQDSFGQMIEFIEPIPLTEEWLLKFGFERTCNHPKHDWIKGEFKICYDVDNDGYIISELLDISIPIKYVHQLQNLYFALTGEELTLNE